MAESRKKLLNVVALACGARYFLVTEDQELEVLVALPTMIFKDRHAKASLQTFDLNLLGYNIRSSPVLVEPV
jgi:hypothetical protein